MEIDKLWVKNSKREKILLMIAAPLILLILVQLFLLQPIETESKELSIKIQAISVEMQKITQQMETTQQLLALSSKIKLNKQLQSLAQQIQHQKILLKQLTDNLIPPQQMATVVEKMLLDRGQLKLLSLSNLEPQGLPQQDDVETTETESEDKVDALVYRHPLKLKFKGKYFQIMEYLKALEKSGYNFYWEQLDYKVIHYPQAEVLITLSTLGTEPHWMGASADEK